MVNFEAEFDIGDIVKHYITEELFVVRFAVFGSTGIAVYHCYPMHAVGKAHEVYTFDEPELKLADED